MRISRTLANNNTLQYAVVSEQLAEITASRYTLKVIFNGQQHFTIGKRELSIFPDCFIVIAPGVSYQCKIDSIEPIKTLSIFFDDAFIESFFQQSNYYSLTRDGGHDNSIWPLASLCPINSDMHCNFKHLLDKLLQHQAKDELINLYLQHCLVNYRKAYLDRLIHSKQKLVFARENTKADVSRKLAAAREFISTNYNKKLRLLDIANFSCLSENHLFRTFKQMYDMSPFQYLTLVRLSRAKIYLEQGEYSVNEVVILVGFESVSTFIQLFKEKFKLTPLKFKKYIQQG